MTCDNPGLIRRGTQRFDLYQVRQIAHSPVAQGQLSGK
jgi:hypothetical protein